MTIALTLHDTDVFAAQIHARYPEGLTGLFAIGATRRTYILERQRDQADIGRIEDFSAMGEYLLTRYHRFCADFFTLGGQNMVIGALSYRSFFERGAAYAAKAMPEVLRLIDSVSIDFYHSYQVDPYFIGLEVLQSAAANPPMRELAARLHEFQAAWTYDPAHRKLFWEIATIPLLSLWGVDRGMSDSARDALDAQIAGSPDFPTIQRTLYDHFTRAILGTAMPMPHLYLGTNMAGDLKFRSPLMLALSGGEYLRAYYTPYPTLFMQRETLQHILADLAFSERLASPEEVDYSGRYTPALVEAEYQRILALADDPTSVLGLTRQVNAQ
ncbi:MAG: hypothetical protein SGJ24_10150 [Chloroflexota bacterium]|nr:hypothetical protein [Chloroflexota bacterium]